MARYASKELVQEVSNLIQAITPFKPKQENHKKCLDYSLSMIFNHTYPDTYKAQIQQNFDALIEKFLINADHGRARELKLLSEQFIKLADTQDAEEKLNMMKLARFVLLMNQQSRVRDFSHHSKTTKEEAEPEQEFDWHSFLNEGVEIDPDIGRCSSDESNWSELSVDEDSPAPSSELAVSSQILTIDETECSSDALTSVEANPSSAKNCTVDAINDAWKAHKPGYVCKTINADPRFPAPKLAQLCSSNRALRILSEYIVVRELIMTLRDQSACGLIFKQEANHTFSVLGDVTVCSISPEMFRSVLGSVTPHLSMLSQLNSFMDSMLPNSFDNSFQFPPKTYLAYAAGLRLFVDSFHAFLLQLETQIRKQEETVTIHSFLSDLDSWFKLIQDVSAIHKKAIFPDYDKQQFWICSTKLLSVLWREAEQATSHEMMTLTFSLMLVTLRPMLDITESWFRRGLIDDSLEEYLISGEVAEAENSLDGDYVLHPFEQSLVDLGVVPFPLLKILADKGLTAGRSICLLRGLDCMEMVPIYHEQATMYEDLIARLKLHQFPTELEAETPLEENSPEKELPSKDPLEQGTVEYILTNCDSNLLQAFGDTVHLGLDVDHTEEGFEYKPVEFPFKFADLCTVQSLNRKVCEIVQQLLEVRVHNLGKLAKDVLQGRCQISNHLSAVQKVAFFEAYFLQEFCSFLVEEVTKNEHPSGWPNWVVLTNRLQVCLSDQHLEWSHLFSIRIADDYTASDLSELTEGFPLMQFINRLSFQYTMEWPTNLFLTPANIKMYNDVFRFILKIKCALYKLQRQGLDGEVLSSNEDVSHRLRILRSWIVFLLRTLQEHILSHILLDLKQRLDEKLLCAVNFHSALEAHDHFVRHAHFSCLLSKNHFTAQEHVMEVVSQAMVICDAFTRQSIESDIIDNMEMKLNLAFNFLTIFFDSVASSGNSVHLMGISVALNDQIPNF